MDDNAWNATRAEPVLPPAAHELGLVDDPAGEAGADESQQPVAVFGAQVMTPARAPLAVDPVDPVQPLEDGNAALFGLPQPQ